MPPVELRQELQNEKTSWRQRKGKGPNPPSYGPPGKENLGNKWGKTSGSVIAFKRKSKHPLRDTISETEEEFYRLVKEWRGATLISSSMTEIFMHPAYMRIIGLGKPAIRLLLRELQRSPNHWFWALHCITGADPIKSNEPVDFEKMTKAWLEWGMEHKYI
jgi:hypothetical protein